MSMLELVETEVKDHHGVLFSGVNLELGSAALGSLVVPSPWGRNALGLVAAGRMRPDNGQVLFNGADSTAELRRASALVDAPGLTAPEHHMKVKGLTAETLGLQPRPHGGKRPRAAEWLEQHDAADLAAEPVEALDPQVRLWLLIELAFADPAVHLAVVESPDRHGLPEEELAETLRYATGDGRSVLAVLSTEKEALL